MQTTIEILVKNGKRQSFIAKKTIELSVIPNRDVEIEDSVWRDATKKIDTIVLSLKDNEIHISLEPDTIVNIEQTKPIYEAHGWQILAYMTC